MTSCLVAINKNRDMCFDMKNGKKTYFSGEIPVNDCRNVWRGLKSIRLIKKKITFLKSFMQRIIQKPILNIVILYYLLMRRDVWFANHLVSFLNKIVLTILMSIIIICHQNHLLKNYNPQLRSKHCIHSLSVQRKET